MSSARRKQDRSLLALVDRITDKRTLEMLEIIYNDITGIPLDNDAQLTGMNHAKIRIMKEIERLRNELS